MANFAAVSDIAAFLQVDIDTPAKLVAAEAALVAASAAIRNYCKQTISLVEDDEITLDSAGGMRLMLPELPVLEVTEVIEDEETLVVDDDFKLGQHGILHRVGRTWAVGIQIVTVTYSHGYTIIPDDIIAVCTRAAARAFQAGLRAAETEGVPGISSKALGDFSVSYQAEQGGGIGEGVMGASAARLLVLSEKDILNRYRINP